MPDLTTLEYRAKLLPIDRFTELCQKWDQEFNTKDGDAFCRGVMDRNKIDFQLRIAEENGLGEQYYKVFYSIYKELYYTHKKPRWVLLKNYE
jgi:hypothetical protein